MIWLYPIEDSFSIFYTKPELPGIIEVESLPEGSGVLKMDKDGKLYWESPKTPIPDHRPPRPKTIEEQFEEVKQQMEVYQQQNLVLLDVNMTIYEELLLMQGRFNNA